MKGLPDSGGVGTGVALSAALALMGCGIGAICVSTALRHLPVVC